MEDKSPFKSVPLSFPPLTTETLPVTTQEKVTHSTTRKYNELASAMTSVTFNSRISSNS